MKKLLVLSVSMLFSAAVFAQAGMPTQGYLDCIKKFQPDVQKHCKTNADAQNKQCMDAAINVQKCGCLHKYGNVPAATCAALKGGKTAKAK